MISRALCVAVLASAVIAAPKPRIRLTESEIVERGLVIVRLDPKMGAAPGECDDLAVEDLSVSVGTKRAKVVSVERVPRPLRHWLLLDISQSAEGRREEAKRSAAQYVREVMTPGVDSAAVLTIDEDPILLAGPSDDPPALARRIEAIPPGGWSMLRDGLDTVLRQIQGDRHEHLVLYWTDGDDLRSMMTPEETLSGLARAPNATVFPIALLPRGSAPPKPPLAGPTFTEVARRSGGEVLISSDPRWLDRVRGWIGRRFTVAFAAPELDKAPTSRAGLVLTVPGKRCHVTMLSDPFARPDAVSGAAPPAPPALVRLRSPSKPTEELPCSTPYGESSMPWDWTFSSERDELSGCMLDLVRSPGPYVRVEDGAKPSWSIHLPRVVSRQVRVWAPERSELPTDPADVIDLLVPEDPAARAPFLMEGNALLTQRNRIATSLFANRKDYHAFALARLQRFADDELGAIERDLAKAFPDLPPGAIRAAARDSRAGRRALEAARTPTDADVVRVLGAWIRDVPASELLLGLERRFIDLRIRGESHERAAARWATIRDRFAVPGVIRISGPLALFRDPAQDVIGFIRIVLPRPERFFPPERPRRDEVPVDARLPARPFALHAVDAVLQRPGVGEALAKRGYRAASITDEPLEPLDRRARMRAYVRARVCVELERDKSKVTLVAEAAVLDDGRVGVWGLDVSVEGDAELAKVLASASELLTVSRD